MLKSEKKSLSELIRQARRGARKVTRLEILTLLYSLEALLEEGKADKANEVIKKVIAEAEKTKPQ